MKIFISYRFTGEDKKILEVILGNITKTLKSKRYDFFCSFYKENYFKEQNFSRNQRYEYYIQKLKDCEIILFFIKSSDDSEGMKIELDQAIKHDKKIVIAIQKNLSFTNFRKNAHDIIEYRNLEHFYKILETYNF
jgi:hypothetical protein